MGPFGLQQTAAPTAEPVTLAEAKARLRVSGTDEDADLLALIAESVRAAEGECGRQFCTASFTLYLDAFPAGNGEIRLPRPPCQSVTSVAYYDGDGVLQTMDAADYLLAAGGEPARLVPAVGESWPTVQDRPEAVRVVYVGGYGTPAAVPRVAKAAILEILAHRWKTRGDESAVGIPPVARRLLDQLEYGELR